MVVTMQIDHNPHEPSRAALKIIGVLTAVIVLAVMVPVTFGMRLSVQQLPEWLLLPIFVGFMCFAAGFFIGRKDAFRQLRTPGRDE